MKYIQIPEPVEVTPFGPNGEPMTEKDGKPVMYSLEKLNEQNVWPHEKWRDDEATLNAFDSIYEKFKASGYKPGAWVALDDAEYELYRPLATMQGQKVRPDMAAELNKIMGAVIRAKSKLPEPPAPPAEAPAANN